MKNRIVITEYNLSNNTVDEISEYVYNYTGNLQLDKSKRIRIRIYLEEILINWLNHFGEGVEVQLVTGKKLGINQLAVRLKGEKHNPINTVDDQYNEYWANVSKQLNLSPSYNYSNGINQITFKVTKDVNSIGQLFFTLLLAAILGFLSQMLPESVRLGVSENILTPIYDSFVGILSTVAGPMIFLSVAWGIYGIGDTETLSKIGRRMLSRFLINTFVATLFSILVCIPLYKLTFANTEIKGEEFSNVFKLLLNIFPKNIVSPFLDGNAMQIILMAIIVGCILVIMGNRTNDVAILIEQINLVINYLMEFVSKLVPGFIFIVVSDMIWKNALGSISTAWKPIVIVLAVAIIALFFNLAILCISNKISFGLIIKKLFPSFIIGITTASSSAAFGTMANSCDKELGINKKVSGFGIPLGIVLYKPASAFSIVACTLYFAEMYNIDISISWIVIAAVAIAIITIAIPPIPGGALACYTIVFAQLGIPTSALTVMLILDSVFDFICTGFDISFRQCELVNLSRKIGMLNTDLLRKKL